MPRLSRLDAPGVLHRVIIRGIDAGGFLETILIAKIFSSVFQYDQKPNQQDIPEVEVFR